MPTKTTSDLRRDMAAQPNLDAYLNDSRPYFTDRKLKGLLEKLYARCGFSKATLARLANMSEVYVYQVFAGRRYPTRDRLLALCVGLGATLDETQVVLRQAAWGELYPRIERDAIIAHGIVHGASLNEINNSLCARGEEPLC